MLQICLVVFLCIFSRNSIADSISDNAESILDLACVGNLRKAYDTVNAVSNMTAEHLHIISALTYILFGEVDESLRLHRLAKAFNPTLMPPLARLFVVDQRQCGGLGDVFYTGAVVIKMLVDANADPVEQLSGHRNMITLCSDSGLNDAARAHLAHARVLAPRDLTLYIREVLMVPPVYESICHVLFTRRQQFDALEGLFQTHKETSRLVAAGEASKSQLLLTPIDEFSLMPNFYFVYQGFSDRPLLERLASAYSLTVPALDETLLSQPTFVSDQPDKNSLRIGFVSSHLKRSHSICKLFCDVISTVAGQLGRKGRLFLFSRAEGEDGAEKELAASAELANIVPVRVGNFLLSNRVEVTSRRVDALIFLDYGLDPSTRMWAASRLAPLQLVTWGHPSTSGLPSLDHFLLAERFYHSPLFSSTACRAAIPSSVDDALGACKSGADAVVSRRMTELVISAATGDTYSDDLTSACSPQTRFSEQVLLTRSLGFSFRRPVLSIFAPGGPSAATEFAAAVADHMAAVSHADDMIVAHADPALEAYFSYSDRLVMRTANFYADLLASDVLVNTGLRSLIRERAEHPGMRVLLCPQHLPKMHPLFDEALRLSLLGAPDAVLVLLSAGKHAPWRLALEQRLDAALRYVPGGAARVVWLDSMTPAEYVMLLAAGDLMLDPFSFGGGVTTLESLAVCTPVVTLPVLQNVPALATGMLAAMQEEAHRLRLVEAEAAFASTVAASVEEYAATVVSLLGSDVRASDQSGSQSETSTLTLLRKAIAQSVHVLYNDEHSGRELATILKRLVLANQ